MERTLTEALSLVQEIDAVIAHITEIEKSFGPYCINRGRITVMRDELNKIKINIMKPFQEDQ